MMNERGFIALQHEVMAILDGRQTMFRRVVKGDIPTTPTATCGKRWGSVDGDHYWCGIKSPYGLPGDRLWVRETFRKWDVDLDGDDGDDSFQEWKKRSTPNLVCYRADGDELDDAAREAGLKWRPSIHMPRWASRTLLEVTSVRVERVGEISEADAMAEGISEVTFVPDDGFPPCLGYMVGKDDGKTGLETRAKNALKVLWDSINANREPENGFPYSWEKSPWVWVVGFKRITP